MYFTQEHEDAIVKYCSTDDIREKTDLYVKWIQPAFNEMVDKIVFTYKFTNLPNIDELRDDCKVWLTTILEKYDPNRGSKAFSYFSVITKNWFIHKVKKNTKRAQREVDYEDAQAEIAEKMVEHGVLAKLAEEERKDPEKDDEIKELREKAAKVRSKQEGPACQDMETYLQLARKIRKEEELAKDGKTRQGLVKFVNLVCPVLKSSYSFILRCTSCERMAKRIVMSACRSPVP